MDKSLSLTIQDEEFIFDCRRTIYWPNEKILLATDLHWGKTTFLQQHGIAVPDKIFEEDLKRLSQVLQDYEVRTMVILGDLIHHEKSLGHGLIERVAHFRDQNPCELLLIQGNHDRFAHFPESWGIVEEKDFKLKNFYFTHEIKPKINQFQFSGHIHPMMKFRSGHDVLRLPVFSLREQSCLLPAFSHLTGGQDLKLNPLHKAIAVMPEGLMLFEKNRDQD